MLTQFNVDGYKIDHYFPRCKLAVECDEFGHKDRDIEYEVRQQKYIENKLRCQFIRFNLDARGFNIFEVANRDSIFKSAAKCKRLQKTLLQCVGCNVLFLHGRQQLTNKMKEDHQQAIEEKDAAIALLNGDLKNRERDNVVLQAQRDVYKDQLQKCQDIITHLKIRHVSHAKDPGKDNTYDY